MRLATSVAVLLGLFLGVSSPVQAVCPVCTIAVGAGLGFSRYLGIDDLVTGLWVGALILSSALWTANWLASKPWSISHPTTLSIILFYALTIPPLFWTGMIGHQGNQFWGIDKILLGTIIGSLVFTAGFFLDKYLRFINEGKVFFYFQKVICPLLLLSLSSFLFYFLTL